MVLLYHTYQSAEVNTTVSVSGILKSQSLQSITVLFRSCIVLQVLKI